MINQWNNYYAKISFVVDEDKNEVRIHFVDSHDCYGGGWGKGESYQETYTIPVKNGRVQSIIGTRNEGQFLIDEKHLEEKGLRYPDRDKMATGVPDETGR